METVNEFCEIKTEINSAITSIEQFDQICRCCLSTENEFCSVFKLQYSENNFVDLLHFCTSIYVSILFNIIYITYDH